MNKKYFADAKKASLLSSDPNTQVGCVIVSDDKIVSVGYNCLPQNLKCEDYPLECRNGEFLDTKYPYILHSEAKAIVDAKCSLVGSDLYVTLFPCNECAKLIIQAGISNIYYLEDKYADTDIVKASKKMLEDSNVIFKQIIL
ncbi:deoxycytidylate deaminase [Mycoplasma sp. P36-A1]|uniref:deoxycytidylate deaminase n=1 Tax=Mycoplasma sp. P36-A1 TaxID=3252900 RepID=UPI003C2DED27